MKFKDFVEHCLRLNSDPSAVDTNNLYSQALLSAVNKFHDIYEPSLSMRSKLSITFYHVALGEQVDEKVDTRKDILIETVKRYFPLSDCNYEFIRGNRLLEIFYRQPEHILTLTTPKYFDYSSYNCNAYVCIVTLPDYYKFITDGDALREYMFEANVRDHAPDAKVNQGISETLMGGQTNEDFWWLNNGITILSTDVSFNHGVLQITDPMIVNGLQTSYEIFNYFSAGGFRNDERKLIIKVIANTNSEVSDHIINATNSQTKIDAINLHATEKIHRNIEMILKGVDLYYDRRKNYYRNRGIAAGQIITIGSLAQSIAAIVMQQPNNARARPTTVASKNYNKLFSERHPPEMYQKCAQITQIVNKFMEDKGVEKGLKLNLLYYLAMYATCSALKSVKPKHQKIASLNVSLLNRHLLESCYEWIYEQYISLGGDDRVAKGPDLVDRIRQQIFVQFGRGKKSKQAELGYENKI